MVKQLKLLAMAGLLAYGHCLPHSALKELCDNKMLEFDYKIVQQVEDISKYFQPFPHYEKMTQELEGCVLSGSSGTLGFYGQMMTDYYREQLQAQHSQEIFELMEKSWKSLKKKITSCVTKQLI